MGMFVRCRDPSEPPLLGDAAGGDGPSLELDGFAEEASISLRNCWLFMAGTPRNGLAKNDGYLLRRSW